ncbi:hypothetical protein Ssi03_25830 [Sphaerisporangium siamense]|uniref:Uncharacterized protein n=1 Tax=Sphaerisporangium siamense TaxID=795645 RepID=A0A7W7G914_9ACTN|nr:hypothetical protein [Sphaerisporangium siamense]MBB4700090.1 hypothetical protein [Sphaerisporangium siamense]GII84593.1 hypothetical protein Ssi03_25830 [Sphaerisporangium siamense]
MARTPITASTTLTEAGIDPTAVDAAIEATDGNSFAWREHRLLFVLNGDDAAVTPTFLTPGTIGRQSLPIQDYQAGACPAGAYRIYGPFGPEFRQPDGSVHVNWSGTTPSNITAAILDA